MNDGHQNEGGQGSAGGARKRLLSGRAALCSALIGALFVACAPAPGPSAPPVSVQTIVPSPSSPPSVGSEPPLNGLEVKVIDALGPLGVQAQRAELSFQSASIWAQLRPGAQLFVNAAPTAAWRTTFSIVDELDLTGIRVQRVKYAADPSLRHRFECSGDTYEVRGAVPTGYDDMDAFVARFIRALGCGA